MIVLDENLDERRVLVPLSARYKGRVVSVRTLRPGSVIKDDAVSGLLLENKNPIFATTNVADFWRKVPAHHGYSVICLPLPTERQHEIPDLIVRLFRHSAFRTAAQRMGRVFRVTLREIQYYQVNQWTASKIHWGSL
ncbi:MAG: hypothetical protein HY735_35655 [Verrucomicrobia bacterium]|nr:hypothetical protein [Verrucomicrobiota bacterium]